MATSTQYREQFYKRLPRGRTIVPEQQGELPGWDELIDALTRYPADLDARARELLDELPDTTSELLASWEALLGLPGECEAEAYASYSEAQRRAAVLAKIRGRGNPDLPSLQEDFRTRASNASALLLQGLFPACAVGLCGVGDGIGSGLWPSVWVFEYMPDVLDPGEDEFSSWSVVGAVTVTDDTYQSPATLEQTAADVDYSGSGSLIGGLTLSNSLDHEVYFSLYARAESGTEQLSISFGKRDGSVSAPQVFDLTETWVKLTYSALIGVGASAPDVRLSAANASFRLSWAWAGERDAALECYTQERDPINCVGLFGVINEYSTSGAAELVDDIDSETLLDDVDLEILIDG